MINIPNYYEATNAAYDILAHYCNSFPKIDVLQIISQMPHIQLCKYSEAANKINVSFREFVLHRASSEHSYMIPNKNGHYIIFYNEYKIKSTIRFNLAHELGHIVLKHSLQTCAEEKEADCFARNILCPIQVIDSFNLSTSQEYVNHFNISEYMANIARQYYNSDNYYISTTNYNRLIDKLFNGLYA